MISKKDRCTVCREFGLVMTLAAVVVGCVVFWKGSPHYIWPFLLAALFLASAAFAPSILDRPERLWMAFGAKLSVLMTFLLVTITFYFVITPIALLLRLMRKDLLQLRLEPERKSYWDPVEPDGPATRPYLPY